MSTNPTNEHREQAREPPAKLVIDAVDDAVMRVGASANCYNEPADANSGAEYVAARVRSVIVGAYSKQAQQGQGDALSSRDAEIREVLEGLRGHGLDDDCWCGPHDHLHTTACLAARALYARVAAKGVE